MVSKDRYVTACQQLLAAAAVSVLALTAAGVATLDIVGPDAATRGVGPGGPTGQRATPDALRVERAQTAALRASQR